MHTHAYTHLDFFLIFGIQMIPTQQFLCISRGIKSLPCQCVLFTPNAWLVELFYPFYHTHFNYFSFDNKENKYEYIYMKQLPKQQQLLMQVQVIAHWAAQMFIFLISEWRLTGATERILPWLSSDKMKYCKMAMLFLYLVIGREHVTVYLTLWNLLQASLQPHMTYKVWRS